MFKWCWNILPYIFKYCVSEGDKQGGAGPGCELQVGRTAVQVYFRVLIKFTVSSVYIFSTKIVKLSSEACEADTSAQYGEWWLY